MFTPAEILAPGSGLCAVIVCVPACALVAVPAAVSCVDETYVVVSAVVPRYPTAPCAKCNPVSVIVNGPWAMLIGDRKSTRLNSSHGYISYAVFCLKKKNTLHTRTPLPVGAHRVYVQHREHCSGARPLPELYHLLCYRRLYRFISILPARRQSSVVS